MKFETGRTFIFAILIFTLTILGIACSQPNGGETSASGTPTASYKKLYEAVKAKNVENIKAMMSKQTIGFAQGVAQRQNAPLDKVLENGFTATTFSPNLPEIRDERIKDGFGSVEVYNSQDKRWEDLPFVLEDGTWKLAVGDLFANTFKLPGKGRAILEMEAANASGNSQMMEMNINGAGNFKGGERPQMPSEANSAAPAANANTKSPTNK